MRSALLMAAMALAPAAWAQPQTQGDAQGQAQPELAGPGHFEELEQARVERISQALGLDAAGTARVKATLDSFRVKGRGLGQQMRMSVRILKQAAAGDAAAQGQVDSALTQLKALRVQQVQLHEQLFDALCEGLSPQQKAKLALALVHPHRGHGRWRALHTR